MIKILVFFEFLLSLFAALFGLCALFGGYYLTFIAAAGIALWRRDKMIEFKEKLNEQTKDS
jgi:hypothetical protein